MELHPNPYIKNPVSYVFIGNIIVKNLQLKGLVNTL
jgi:hypothetical protein